MDEEVNEISKVIEFDANANLKSKSGNPEIATPKKFNITPMASAKEHQPPPAADDQKPASIEEVKTEEVGTGVVQQQAEQQGETILDAPID